VTVIALSLATCATTADWTLICMTAAAKETPVSYSSEVVPAIALATWSTSAWVTCTLTALPGPPT